MEVPSRGGAALAFEHELLELLAGGALVGDHGVALLVESACPETRVSRSLVL
jgi:hypothetical protein